MTHSTSANRRIIYSYCLVKCWRCVRGNVRRHKYTLREKWEIFFVLVRFTYSNHFPLKGPIVYKYLMWFWCQWHLRADNYASGSTGCCFFVKVCFTYSNHSPLKDPIIYKYVMWFWLPVAFKSRPLCVRINWLLLLHHSLHQVPPSKLGWPRSSPVYSDIH